MSLSYKDLQGILDTFRTMATSPNQSDVHGLLDRHAFSLGFRQLQGATGKYYASDKETLTFDNMMWRYSKWHWDNYKNVKQYEY